MQRQSTSQLWAQLAPRAVHQSTSSSTQRQQRHTEPSTGNWGVHQCAHQRVELTLPAAAAAVGVARDGVQWKGRASVTSRGWRLVGDAADRSAVDAASDI